MIEICLTSKCQIVLRLGGVTVYSTHKCANYPILKNYLVLKYRRYKDYGAGKMHSTQRCTKNGIFELHSLKPITPILKESQNSDDSTLGKVKENWISTNFIFYSYHVGQHPHRASLISGRFYPFPCRFSYR